MIISGISKYIKPFFLSFTAIALCMGCSNTIADEEEIIIPGRSIEFGTGDTSRAEQIARMRGQDFGIKGFILDNVWESAGYNAIASPDWNNVRVSCDDNGICTYSPLQVWQDNKYYSFFGYYPYSDPAVTVSDASHESTPYLIYRPSANDPRLHRDVMVASTLDRSSVNTGQVRLQFSHVLFCVNLAVNNSNDEAIRLENVVLTFTTDLYSTYRINMDKSNPQASGRLSNASYLMAADTTIPNTVTTGGINITEHDRFLMLIPQTGLKGKISFAVTQNGVTTQKEVEFDDAGTSFRAGYRYTFTLYFLGDAINFKIVQNNEWTDNDSNIEFD